MIEVCNSGSGGYHSIQEAVDTAGKAGDSPCLILIRDGAYEEGARIEEGWLRIAGESAQRVVLKAPILVTGGSVELENLRNGPDMVGQNNDRAVPSLFLCGCREAVPSGQPRQPCYIYDETLPGGTVKETVVTGLLGRVELFLRPGDTLAMLIGADEGTPGRYFCPANGREFPLYLEVARNAAMENGASFLLIGCQDLPEAHRAALLDYAVNNRVPYSAGAWSG